MSRVAAILLMLLWPAVAAAQLAVPGDGEDVVRVDDRGRSMRVTFPLHDRLWLRGGYATGPQPSSLIELGISFSLRADFPEEEIWWQLRHDVAKVQLRLQRSAALGVTFFEGDYLRHDKSSNILIPRGKRDIRLPAPFDIAVVWMLGRLDVDVQQGIEAADVAEIAVLADFIRDEAYRHRLAVGPSGRYEALRLDPSWRHDVVPFSGVMALYGWEARNGRFSFLVRQSADYTAAIEVSSGVDWSWRLRTMAELEWVSLAINDLPLSLSLEGAANHQLGGSTDWTAGVSARLALPLGI